MAEQNKSMFPRTTAALKQNEKPIALPERGTAFTFKQPLIPSRMRNNLTDAATAIAETPLIAGLGDVGSTLAQIPEAENYAEGAEKVGQTLRKVAGLPGEALNSYKGALKQAGNTAVAAVSPVLKGLVPEAFGPGATTETVADAPTADPATGLPTAPSMTQGPKPLTYEQKVLRMSGFDENFRPVNGLEKSQVGPNDRPTLARLNRAGQPEGMNMRRANDELTGSPINQAQEGELLPPQMRRGRQTAFERAGIAMPELKGDSFRDLRDFRLQLLSTGAKVLPAQAELNAEAADRIGQRKDDRLTLRQLGENNRTAIAQGQLGVNAARAIAPGQAPSLADTVKETEALESLLNNPTTAPMGPAIGRAVYEAAANTGLSMDVINDALVRKVDASGEANLNDPSVVARIQAVLPEVLASLKARQVQP